jgi:crotonobetainyl-CoA:carnitine CoA-transferase CaiB-like acyl-CoA transferase
VTEFPRSDGSALSDLRIIDMATIVAGPAAAKYLGDYGAEVIKVESPTGDSARRLGWALNDGDDSFFWKIIGRNKKCVAIDIKSEAGLEHMLQLTDSADVLIENFRPGTLERLGLGPDLLLGRNPRLVVLRVTGFGQTGPYAGRPGFATVVEALTGYAALSGEPDGQPLLPPIAITDEVAGLAGAFSVMAALWYARRTGHGQVVDVNLAETLLQLMGPLVPAFAHLGYQQPRMGSSLPWTVPRGTYQCSDGQWVAISASADSVAARLMNAIGLAGDKRFATFRDRMTNQEVLEDYVRNWVGERTSKDVIAHLEGLDAAVAPLYTMRDVFADAHFRERQVMVEVDGIVMQNVIARFSATPGKVRHAGRRHGADQELVGQELSPLDAPRANLPPNGGFGDGSAGPS